MRWAWLAAACVTVVAPACSYDWKVPAPIADASSESVAPPADAATEADVAVIPEASPDVVTHDATPDAPEDTNRPPCTASQEDTVQQARAAALACNANSVTPCPGTVTDECGCTVLVGEANTGTLVQDYIAAIAQLQAAECKPNCPGCPVLSTIPGCDAGPSACIARLCLVADAGGGSYACYQ
jgi:hypothetical protein